MMLNYREKANGTGTSRNRRRNILCIVFVVAVFLILTLGFLVSDGMLNSFWLPRFAARAGLQDFSSEDAVFSFFFTPSLKVKKIRFKHPSGYSIATDSLEADWHNGEFFFSRQRKIRKMRVNGFSVEKIPVPEKKERRTTASSSASGITAQEFFLTMKDGSVPLSGTENRLAWKQIHFSAEKLSLFPLSGKFLFSGGICGQSDKEIIVETPNFSGNVKLSLKSGIPHLTNLQLESGTLAFFPAGKISLTGTGELTGEIRGKNMSLQGKFRESGGSLLCWELKKTDVLSCDYELLLAQSDLSARISELYPFLNLSGLKGRTEGNIRLENGLVLFQNSGNLNSESFRGRKNAILDFQFSGSFPPAGSRLDMKESSIDFSLEGKSLLACRLKKGNFSPRETEFPEGTVEFTDFPLDIFLPFYGFTSSGKINCSRTAGEKSLILQLELSGKESVLASADGELKILPDSWSGRFAANHPEGTALWETSGSIRPDGSFNGWTGTQNRAQAAAFLIEGDRKHVEITANSVPLDILNGRILPDRCSFAETVFRMRHSHDSKDGNIVEKGELKLDNLCLAASGEKFSFAAAYEYNLSSGSGKASVSAVSGEKKTPFADLTLSLQKERIPAVLLQSTFFDIDKTGKVLSLFRNALPNDCLPAETVPFSPEEREKSSVVDVEMKEIRCSDGSSTSCKGKLRFMQGKTDFSGLDFTGSSSGKDEFLKLFSRQ